MTRKFDLTTEAGYEAYLNDGDDRRVRLKESGETVIKPEHPVVKALQEAGDQPTFPDDYRSERIAYECKQALPIARSICDELMELREKAAALPIIEKILSRAKRGKLTSGNPAKWYGLSATHEEIEQLRQMIEQKERT